MNDSGTFDRLSGKAKEAAGKVTGDRQTETEGRLQQAEDRVNEEIGRASCRERV